MRPGCFGSRPFAGVLSPWRPAPERTRRQRSRLGAKPLISDRYRRLACRIPGMTRCVTAAVSVLSTAVLVLGFAGPASADPSSDASPEPSCTYTLSSPQLVQVSGVTMVTATLAPFPCTGSINPNSMTVCVKAQGDGTNGKCAFGAKPIAAQVSYASYRPGTTYVSEGRGCGSVFTAEGSVCSSVGPKTAT